MNVSICEIQNKTTNDIDFLDILPNSKFGLITINYHKIKQTFLTIICFLHDSFCSDSKSQIKKEPYHTFDSSWRC